MAINFPASPTLNQTFSSGNVNYVWDGTKWTASVTGGISLDKIEEGNTSAEVIDTGSDGRFVVTTEGTEKLRVDSNGDVTINDKIVHSGDTNTAIRFPAADIVSVETNGSERARIDSSGRLLVGTSSASSVAKLQVQGYVGDNTGVGLVELQAGSATPANGTGIGRIDFSNNASNRGAVIAAERDGGTWTSGSSHPGRLVFYTTADGASSPTERMRINQNGTTGINVTSATDVRLSVRGASGDSATLILDSTRAAATDWYLLYGTSGTGGTLQAWIRGDGTYGSRPNVYGGVSDIKLKENISPANSQWNDVKSIELVNYNFIGDDMRQLGVVAQQVETVSPGLVDETKDKDSEGNETGEVTKLVKYSVLYLKAVKALQEAMERIETLEAKVAALEGV
jgi:hypothetical protein